MHAPALLALAALVGAAAPPAVRAPPATNELAAPARCALRYLDAVRLAGARSLVGRGGPPDARADGAVATARALLAPRTLAEVERRAARGEDHPVASFGRGGRRGILESFRLEAARRAPRGTVVVTVSERLRPLEGPQRLELAVSEVLVARVEGSWRVVDRLPGAAFDDGALGAAYAGFFDEPQAR